MKDLNIVVEANIPYIRGVLEPYGNVTYLGAGDIDTRAVADADALIVRTRTRCDASLLDGSRCQFIATATIGTDHIDMPWCASRGIEVANAPGCNAPAVAQYVFASLAEVTGSRLHGKTIGIVGVGNVGSIVARWAPQLGMRAMLCDPPREMAEGGDGWHTLAEIAGEADIITFHTPLDETTRHIVDQAFIGSLRHSPVLVNAARGGITDTQALIAGLETGKVSQAVIDCWEGEPEISPALLSMAAVATPHIAGYNHEGKVRATRMALDAFARHFGLPHIPMAETAPSGAAPEVTLDAITRSYDPAVDTRALKDDPTSFETLRNRYNISGRHDVGVDQD